MFDVKQIAKERINHSSYFLQQLQPLHPSEHAHSVHLQLASQHPSFLWQHCSSPQVLQSSPQLQSGFTHFSGMIVVVSVLNFVPNLQFAIIMIPACSFSASQRSRSLRP
eukprot:512350_1